MAERGIPVIDRFGVDPAPGSVQVETNPDATISFYVPFRAEDNGTDLQAIFWRDFNPLDPPTDLTTLIRIQDVPASGLPFSEQPAERAVSVDWSPRGLGGCHSVTMFLTYVDNVIFEDVPTIDEESLVAVETWWFRFEIPGAPDPDCPAVPVETSL